MADHKYLNRVGIWFNPGQGGVQEPQAWPVRCSACEDPIPDWKYKLGDNIYGCDDFLKNKWCSEDRMQLPDWMGKSKLWDIRGTQDANPLEACCGCGAISEPCPASHPFAFSPTQGMSGCCETADPKIGEPLGQNALPDLWKRANTCRGNAQILPDPNQSMSTNMTRNMIWKYRPKTDHASDCLDPVPLFKLIWSKDSLNYGTLTCHDFRRRNLCSPQGELLYNKEPLTPYHYEKFLRKYDLNKLTDENGYSPFEACCACGSKKPLAQPLIYNDDPDTQLPSGTELNLLANKFNNTTVKTTIDGDEIVVTVNTQELDSQTVPTRPHVHQCRDLVPGFNLEGNTCSVWNEYCKGQTKPITHDLQDIRAQVYTFMEACCECGAMRSLSQDLPFWEYDPSEQNDTDHIPSGSLVRHMDLVKDGYTVVQYSSRQVWVKEADLQTHSNIVMANTT